MQSLRYHASRRTALKILIFLVLAAVTVLLVALGTETGRLTMARAALRRFQDPRQHALTVTGLRWPRAGSLSAAQVYLADRQGNWLRIEAPTLELDLAALFRKRIHLRSAKADGLKLMRLPRRRQPVQDATPTDSRWRLELDHLQVKQVTLDPAGAPARIQGAVTGQGSLGMAEGRISLDAPALVLGEPTAKVGMTLSWTTRDEHRDVSLSLRAESGAARADVVFNAGCGVASTGSITRLDTRWLPLASTTGIHGVVQADWAVSSQGATPVGTAYVAVTGITADERKLAQWLPAEASAEVRVEGSSLHIEGHTGGHSNVFAAVEASLPCLWQDGFPWCRPDPDGSLQAQLEARGELAALVRNRLPAWQTLRGDVDIKLHAEGVSTNPVVSGRIALNNGYFEDPVRGTVARDITIQVRATRGNSFQISGRAGDGLGGAISLTGTVARAGAGPFISTGAATVSHFTAARLLNTGIPIDGSIGLRGTGSVVKVTGELRTPAIRLRLPRQLPPSITDIKVVDIRSIAPIAATSRPTRTWPIAVDTDIQILAEKDVRIEGNQLRTEWRGQGRITGRAPDLRFGGSVTIVRGSFLFLGRRFTIQRGEVVVPAGDMTQPVLFITAETRAAGATIRLTVEGTSREPSLELSSDPPLDRNEIVSRLLFGRPGDAVSPWQLAYLAYALDVIEGGGPLLQTLDRGQNRLGFDQIGLAQSETESGVSGITLGKQLSDRIYLESEVGFHQESSVLALETELTPHVILRTETARMRDGISINWRYDY